MTNADPPKKKPRYGNLFDTDRKLQNRSNSMKNAEEYKTKLRNQHEKMGITHVKHL